MLSYGNGRVLKDGTRNDGPGLGRFMYHLVASRVGFLRFFVVFTLYYPCLRCTLALLVKIGYPPGGAVGYRYQNRSLVSFTSFHGLWRGGQRPEFGVEVEVGLRRDRDWPAEVKEHTRGAAGCTVTDRYWLDSVPLRGEVETRMRTT